MAKDIIIVKEKVDTSMINLKDLTTDCHYVYRSDDIVDIVRGQTMVQIFDYYYDKGIKLNKIEVAGGKLNPKLCKPTLDKDK